MNKTGNSVKTGAASKSRVGTSKPGAKRASAGSSFPKRVKGKSSRNFRVGKDGRGKGKASKRQKFRKRREEKSKDGDNTIQLEGVIHTVLPGTMFRVELENGKLVLGHISGKMRKRFIKLVIGDRVRIEMSPYDLEKARIVYRIR